MNVFIFILDRPCGPLHGATVALSLSVPLLTRECFLEAGPAFVGTCLPRVARPERPDVRAPVAHVIRRFYPSGRRGGWEAEGNCDHVDGAAMRAPDGGSEMIALSGGDRIGVPWRVLKGLLLCQ